jgi:hypothetical protein
MKYYLGAYYLIKLRPVDFGRIMGSKILTCSSCINDSYLDSWSLSWTNEGKGDLERPKQLFGLSDSRIKEIQQWADKQFDDNKIGWINIFADFLTLNEYKSRFFQYDRDSKIISINFPETEKNALLIDFKTNKQNIGAIGLWNNLNRGIPEILDDSEIILGYDLIGIESGGDFHTFHCHDLSDDLIKRFKLKINEFGLISKYDDWTDLTNYMNDENNGFEPVPWYFVKVKLINEDKKSKPNIKDIHSDYH